MNDPFPPRRFTNEQRAERHNKRTAQRFPLFAATATLDQVVTPWTAQTLADMERDYVEKTTRDRRAAYADGALMRRQAAERMTRAELREHDRRFSRTYPHKGEYWADYWHAVLLRQK